MPWIRKYYDAITYQNKLPYNVMIIYQHSFIRREREREREHYDELRFRGLTYQKRVKKCVEKSKKCVYKSLSFTLLRQLIVSKLIEWFLSNKRRRSVCTTAL